jgi:hypothetical protein
LSVVLINHLNKNYLQGEEYSNCHFVLNGMFDKW